MIARPPPVHARNTVLAIACVVFALIVLIALSAMFDGMMR